MAKENEIILYEYYMQIGEISMKLQCRPFAAVKTKSGYRATEYYFSPAGTGLTTIDDKDLGKVINGYVVLEIKDEKLACEVFSRYYERKTKLFAKKISKYNMLIDSADKIIEQLHTYHSESEA